MTTNSNELKVLCTSNKSTKLIKGAIYIATSMHTYNNSKTIYIKGVGNFSIDNFTLLNGKSLKNIPNFSERETSLDYNKNYTGQYIKCRYSGSCKSLKNEEIYFVENQQEVKRGRYRRSIKLKIRGIKNLVSFYRFEEIPISEQRNLKLKNLNNEEIQSGEKTRKFLLYSEKEKVNIIFEILYKVSFDINNTLINNTDIIKLILNKGKNYAIVEEDINYYLNFKLVNLIEKLK